MGKILVMTLVARVGLCVLAACAAAIPARAQSLISPLRSSAIRPDGDAIVFSRYDSAINAYRLSEWSAGAVRTFAIRPRTRPFDVDVGPDEHGRQVAVYTRCAREPLQFGPGTVLPYFRTGRACRLFAMDLRSGHERRVAGVDRSGSSFLPTIWRSRIAWAQVIERPHGSVLRLRLREGGRHPRTVRGGTRSAPLGDAPAVGPLSLDLRADRMALTWSYYDRRAGCGKDPKIGPLPVSEAWLYTFGVSRRRIAHAGCPQDGPRAFVTWSSLDSGGVSYVSHLAQGADPRGQDILHTIGFGGGPSRSTALSTPRMSDFVVSFAVLASGAVAYSFDGSTNGLSLAAPAG